MTELRLGNIVHESFTKKRFIFTVRLRNEEGRWNVKLFIVEYNLIRFFPHLNFIGWTQKRHAASKRTVRRPDRAFEFSPIAVETHQEFACFLTFSHRLCSPKVNNQVFREHSHNLTTVLCSGIFRIWISSWKDRLRGSFPRSWFTIKPQ